MKGSKKRTGDTPDSLFAKFIKRAEDPAYFLRFLTTLEINKVEAKFQRRESPPIFLKSTDDFGVVAWYARNPFSPVLVPEPKAVTRVSLDEFQKSLTTELTKKLAAMFIVSGLEQAIQSMHKPLDLVLAPPVFSKEFDENGVVATYSLNCNIKLVKR